MTSLSVRAVPFQSHRLQIGLGLGIVFTALLWLGVFQWNGQPPGNDDMMRLVQVRDLLAGQGWGNVDQARLVTPEGGAMHWSRVPDMFVGGLVVLLTPFFGAEGAEFAALALWPRLVLLGTLAAIALIVHRLGAGRIGVAASVAAFLFSHAVVQFQPGRIDHHGLVLMLVLFGVAALCGPSRGLKSGLVVAASATLSLTIAMESLPYAGGLLGLAGMLWVLRGAAEGQLMKGVGLGLIVFAPLVYALDAPGLFGERGVCDAFGTFHLAALVLAGLGFAGFGLSGERIGDWRQRLIVAAGTGLGVGLAAIAINPACLGSPYGSVDTTVMDNWLSSVWEARNLPKLAATAPDAVVMVFGYAGAALLGGLIALGNASKEDRTWLAGIVALTALATLVATWQVRAALFAHGFAAICVGVLAAQLIERARNSEGPARIGLIALMFAFSPTTWTTLSLQLSPEVEPGEMAEASGGEPVDCRSREALAGLAGLPPAHVFTPIDLGSSILLHTHHSVSAAPYHRNSGAIERAIVAFQSSPEDAFAMVRASGADYLVFCDSIGETKDYMQRAPDGLAARLAAGEVPAWLSPLEGAAAPTGIAVWRVRSDAIASTGLN